MAKKLSGAKTSPAVELVALRPVVAVRKDPRSARQPTTNEKRAFADRHENTKAW